MIDVVGDSARGEEFALVRLTVDGDRIVDADAPGLARPLAGLTLLEAAAVPGETLAADALANALGPGLRRRAGAGPRRRRDERRRRQRRRAAPLRAERDRRHAPPLARPGGPGRRARLLLARRGHRRARDLPRARPAARHARPARAVPPRRRRPRSCAPTPAARRRTRAAAATARFRFAELLAFARRAGAERLATGHYARIAEHRGRRLLARAADDGEGPVVHARDARSAPPRPDRVPARRAGQGRRRAPRPPRAGLAVAERRESQEACFLAGGDYRDFLARHGLETREGPIVDEDGRELGRHEGTWRFTPGQRRGIGVGGGRAALRASHRRRDEHARRRPEALRSPRASVDAAGRLHVPVERADAKLRYRSPAVPARVEATPRGFRLALDEPAEAVARGQIAVLYEGDAVVGAGRITERRLGSPRDPARQHRG